MRIPGKNLKNLDLDEHSGLIRVVPQIKSVPLLIGVDVQSWHLTNHLQRKSFLFSLLCISSVDLLEGDKLSWPGEDRVLHQLFARHAPDLEDLEMANLQEGDQTKHSNFKFFAQTSSELSAKLSPDTWKLLNLRV